MATLSTALARVPDPELHPGCSPVCGRNRLLHLNPCLAYGEAGEGPGTVTLPSAPISLQRQQVTLVAPVLA